MATILIVDDVAAYRSPLVALLGLQGHRVIEASDGRKALDAIALVCPDLIITDVLMPVMDGYELMTRLRLDPATRAIPVLFYTAPYGEREARALAGSVPFVLRKPADPDRVLQLVASILAKEAVAPEDGSAIAATGHQLRLSSDESEEAQAGLRVENAQLRAVINVTLQIAAERDSKELLVNVCAAASDLFGATYATIGIVEPTARTLQRVLCCGLGSARACAADWISHGDAAPGIFAKAVASRHAVRGGNPGGDPTALGLPAAHPPIEAYLVAPLRSDGHVYGWICLVGNEGRSFTDRDEQLLLALAAQVGHVYELAREISERKEAELALRHERDRTQYAFEAAGVGIWDFDPRTGAVLWSREIESQHGVPPGTFGGTFDAFIDAVHAEDQVRVRAIMETAFASGDPYRLQYRVQGPDGSVRWLGGAGRILQDAAGAPERGIGISLDITERRAHEGKSQQAQKMEAVGRLAGGVAHDFNNLLTAILGYCELLLDALPGDDVRRLDVAQIQSAGNSAADLTRQLLAFSRKEVIEHTLFDLNTVVADMRPMLERLIAEDVRIVLSTARAPAVLRADRGQIQQIVMNLALNARDAMPAGGTLAINVWQEDDARVALRVTDTGSGMTADVQRRLFEPFFTTKPPGQGTGLGLATVQNIVTQGGGTIAVDSVVGRGTIVTVMFPGADARELQDMPSATAMEVPPPVAHTVLLVEDSDSLRALATRLLERHGYTAWPAANAPEALAIVDQGVAIDVLLTDVVMPGGSGPQLATTLLERLPLLKVIYMSGYAADASLREGVFAGDVAFLRKPFTSIELGQKVRDVLDVAPAAC